MTRWTRADSELLCFLEEDIFSPLTQLTRKGEENSKRGQKFLLQNEVNGAS